MRFVVRDITGPYVTRKQQMLSIAVEVKCVFECMWGGGLD